MDEIGRNSAYSAGVIWGWVCAVGLSVWLYLPVQGLVLAYLPVDHEATQFFGAVLITLVVAAGAGWFVRLFGDWLLARTAPTIHPLLWMIPIVLGGVPLALALG